MQDPPEEETGQGTADRVYGPAAPSAGGVDTPKWWIQPTRKFFLEAKKK